jgi:DoxX-like family
MPRMYLLAEIICTTHSQQVGPSPAVRNRKGMGISDGGLAVLHRSFYWSFTLLLVAWLLAGGGLDLARAPGAIAILRTLGYPPYLCTILGVAKLMAVPAILYYGAGRIQEWAYAGVTFDGLGAFVSHVASHDSTGSTIAPLLFLGFAVVSYVLRPAPLRSEFGPGS